ncbi:hypothetical protein LIA77_09754 [Sarocladium implicatum]|nr:hypothetical protein LIA77_09754 [Sarocladium implicatum]
MFICRYLPKEATRALGSAPKTLDRANPAVRLGCLKRQIVLRRGARKPRATRGISACNVSKRPRELFDLCFTSSASWLNLQKLPAAIRFPQPVRDSIETELISSSSGGFHPLPRATYRTTRICVALILTSRSDNVDGC